MGKIKVWKSNDKGVDLIDLPEQEMKAIDIDCFLDKKYGHDGWIIWERVNSHVC